MTGLETVAVIQLFDVLYGFLLGLSCLLGVCLGVQAGVPFPSPSTSIRACWFCGQSALSIFYPWILNAFFNRASSCRVLAVSYSFHLSPFLCSLGTSYCSFLPWIERFMDCPSPKGWMSRKRNMSPPVPSSLEWAVVVKALLVLSRS